MRGAILGNLLLQGHSLVPHQHCPQCHLAALLKARVKTAKGFSDAADHDEALHDCASDHSQKVTPPACMLLAPSRIPDAWRPPTHCAAAHPRPQPCKIVLTVLSSSLLMTLYQAIIPHDDSERCTPAGICGRHLHSDAEHQISVHTW